MENKLVMLKSNEVFTSSKIIADGTNNQYHSVTALIQRYETDIADF